MKEYVLDANAVVRLYRNTPGAETVEALIRQAKAGRAHLSMSVANLGEVFYVLLRYMTEEQAERCIGQMRPAVSFEGIDEETALSAARLRNRYKLGYADCFAAALALKLGATLVTADPEFAKLGRRLKVQTLPRHLG